MLINVATVIILIVIGNFLTGAFMLAYHFNFSETPCKKAFFLAKALQAIGFILLLLRDYVPEFASVLFGNMILLVAIMFETVALIQVKRPFKGGLRITYFSIASVGIIAFIVAYFWLNTEANRTFVFAFFSALLLTGTIYTYLTDRKRSHLQTLIAIIHIILVGFLGFRAFNAYFELIDYSLLSTHWFNQLSFAALFAHMMTVNIGFILLTKQKTDAVLIEAATIDQLTQVYNRQTFLKHVQKIINQSREDGTPVSVWMLDIDNFKDINDTHGHMMGDQVLFEIASLIKQTLQEKQVFGRFGGDEFASIMAESDDSESSQYLNALCKVIAATTFTAKKLTLTVSIGVVTLIPHKDTSFDTFYRLADEGLYIAKKSNKSTWKRTYLRLTPAPEKTEATHA